MRVSVSDVDQYLYYLKSDMTLKSLLARLRREEAPTEAMLAGTAFHSVLENAVPRSFHSVTQDGFRFDFELDAELALPDIRELKAEKQFGEITLVGKVDAMYGNTIFDHKLSKRFNPEAYTNAFQWRAYLSIFDADKFTYNVFIRYTDLKTKINYVKEFNPITFYRYKSLQSDVQRTLDEYAEFAHKYLVRETETAAGGN